MSVAAGPVGRTAETSVALQSAIYSYSRSEGFFAGVSLERTVVSVRDEAYYGKPVTPQEILSGKAPPLPGRKTYSQYCRNTEQTFSVSCEKKGQRERPSLPGLAHTALAGCIGLFNQVKIVSRPEKTWTIQFREFERPKKGGQMQRKESRRSRFTTCRSKRSTTNCSPF